jgi:hypothetical protein
MAVMRGSDRKTSVVNMFTYDEILCLQFILLIFNHQEMYYLFLHMISVL